MKNNLKFLQINFVSSAGVAFIIMCIIRYFKINLDENVYSLIPSFSIFLSWLINWVLAYVTPQSPQFIAVDRRLKRNAKVLREMISDPTATEDRKKELQKQYDDVLMSRADLYAGENEITEK